MKQLELNLIFATGSPDAVPIGQQDRRFMIGQRHYLRFDPQEMQQSLLAILQPDHWHDLFDIHREVGERYSAFDLSDLLDKMAEQGLIEIDRHYFGSDCPSKDNYLGYKNIYRLPA